MKHRCELRFRSHWAFIHASLSHVPLCVSWAFLVSMVVAVIFASLEDKSVTVRVKNVWVSYAS